MAVKKAEKVRSKTSRASTKTVKSNTGFFDYFRFGESYTSLILGMVVIIIAAILLVSFLKSRGLTGTNNRITDTSSTNTTAEQQVAQDPNSYTVAEGDTLWSIAEKNYKSGFNWVEIAKANKLEDPNNLSAGTKLILPEVASDIAAAPEKEVESANAPNKISGTTYKVAEGDYLWDIAERAYGDGYKWVEIARLNNITNPDVIFKDTTLNLQR